MKKILLVLVLLLSTIQLSFADYTLPDNDVMRVEKAIKIIETYIEKKWEPLREKLLNRIDVVLDMKNLSDKNIAIFSLLKLWLEWGDLDSETDKWEWKVTAEHFKFIFDSWAYRCDKNPCETYNSIVKIQWIVSHSYVKYVEINDYRLKSYAWSNWEYNANSKYWNFKDWKNVYVINYLSENNQVLYSEDYIITKKTVEDVAEDVAATVAFAVADIQTDTVDSNIPTEAQELPAELQQQNNEIKQWTIVNSSALWEKNYDEKKVRTYWIWLLNWVRTNRGLSPYSYDSSLDITSQIWSNMAYKRWYIDHKVTPWDSYYNYNKKVSWMDQNGVICKNVHRATFSESIAWGSFYCSSNDCSDKITKVMDDTFKFYMDEEWTANDPHFRAIVHKYFETMGLGLSVKDEWNNKFKLYLTNHYCTQNIK